MTGARSERQIDRKALAALLMLLVVEAAIRAPAFTQGGFVSHDVGGILYSAMVLHDGGLPYVDTVELKGPGTFYLAWALAGADGRDIAQFQVMANLWAMCGTCLVFQMTRRVGGVFAATVAGLLYVLHQPWLDSMDANYVTWANTFQIAAVGMVWRGAGERVTSTGWRWVVAGLLATAAALCKRQAGFVVFGLLWCALVGVGGEGDGGRDRIRRALALFVGGLSPLLAGTLHYASHGEGAEFIRGFAFNEWGWRYAAAGGGGDSVLWEGLLATTYFLALPLGLVILGLGLGRGVGLGAQQSGGWAARGWRGLLVWFLAMIATAWVGGRFYKGYYALTLAPAVILAGSAVGAVWARVRTEDRGWTRALGGLAVVVLIAGLGRAGVLVTELRAARSAPRDLGARRLAAHVEAHTSAADTIWVWGWHLWDVYPLAGRRSGSTIYKSLGVLTPPNDDTWRRRAGRLKFVPSERSTRLLEELAASRPRFIILGSTVPHRSFKALRKHLAADYVRDRTISIGRVETWKLREVP